MSLDQDINTIKKRKVLIPFLIIIFALIISVFFIVMHFSQKKKNTPVAYAETIALNEKSLYASVQHYMEWGLYEQFADYYFNYASDEQHNYYYEKADIDEIYALLKEIYSMTFDYDTLTLKSEDNDCELSLQVQIMDETYRYVFKGEFLGNQSYRFNKACLYKEDGTDCFADMNYSLSAKVTVKANQETDLVSTLQNPSEEYVAYCDEYNYLNNNTCTTGEPVTLGTYYQNGNIDGNYYTILKDNQIAISNQENNYWYYKTQKEDDGNYLYYGYRLDCNGITGGYRIKYDEKSLISENKKFLVIN